VALRAGLFDLDTSDLQRRKPALSGLAEHFDVEPPALLGL
jgi:hypothetical protein